MYHRFKLMVYATHLARRGHFRTKIVRRNSRTFQSRPCKIRTIFRSVRGSVRRNTSGSGGAASRWTLSAKIVLNLNAGNTWIAECYHTWLWSSVRCTMSWTVNLSHGDDKLFFGPKHNICAFFMILFDLILLFVWQICRVNCETEN